MRAVAGAIVALIATAGLAFAATDAGDGARPAVGEARALPAAGQAGGGSHRGRPKRRTGLKAPPASSAALVTAAPAPERRPSEPGLEQAMAAVGADAAADPPPAPEPPTATEPPAAEPPAAPEPPAPEPPPAAEEPEAEPPPAEEPEAEPPAPAEPVPEPEPEAPAEAPKEPAGIDPGVPLEPPAPSDDLVVGIDGGYTGWSSTETAYRAQLGAAVTRHEWDPQDPVAEQDDEVRIAAERIGTRIHALLGANQLGEPGHYRDWVVAFIRRYGAGGSFWAEHPQLNASRYAITTVELGNEPYFGAMSPTEYADTVLPTLEAIDGLDLPVKVILPAYLHGANTSWIDTLYERVPGLNSLFYAFAFHPYWYGHHPATSGDSGPFDRLDTLRERMDELGAAAKPIYLTEYGESTASCGSECVSEAEQAEHLGAMLTAVVARSDWDVEMLSIFQLLDRGTDDADRERQFGILREDGTPKPSYSLVRAAVQAYR